jgi:hypothetical protein
MTSELSIFAARLRAFMDISMEDYAQFDAASAQALAQHADAEFNGMALVLFALQFGRNQPYRKLCDARVAMSFIRAGRRSSGPVGTFTARSRWRFTKRRYWRG